MPRSNLDFVHSVRNSKRPVALTAIPLSFTVWVREREWLQWENGSNKQCFWLILKVLLQKIVRGMARRKKPQTSLLVDGSSTGQTAAYRAWTKGESERVSLGDGQYQYERPHSFSNPLSQSWSLLCFLYIQSAASLYMYLASSSVALNTLTKLLTIYQPRNTISRSFCCIANAKYRREIGGHKFVTGSHQLLDRVMGGDHMLRKKTNWYTGAMVGANRRIGLHTSGNAI